MIITVKILKHLFVQVMQKNTFNSSSKRSGKCGKQNSRSSGYGWRKSKVTSNVRGILKNAVLSVFGKKKTCLATKLGFKPYSHDIF